MIPYITIKTRSAAGFFDEYEMDDEILTELERMTDDGFELEATDLFVNDYMIPPAIKYQNLMSEYLSESDDGPMRDKDQDKVTRNISLLTVALISLLISNFTKYTKQSYSGKMFKDAEIDDEDVQKVILNETISEFDNLVSGTMARTQGFILNSLRTLQREMIAENLLIRNSQITGEILEAEILRFKDSLRIKYPEIYKAMEKGNLMTTVKFVDGQEFTRHYKLDYYMDLSTRTTLLNVNRNANLISAHLHGDSVVEYYLADPRTVKKDREICQEILAHKVGGYSLLALNEEAGKRLGIMTVDEAKSTPDFAMAAYCRHSIRRCSEDFLKTIKEL